MLDEAANEVLSSMDFPRAHREQIASTSPLGPLDAKIKRRTDVVGIFPTTRDRKARWSVAAVTQLE